MPRDAGAWLATIARHESWARSRHQPPVPLHVELPDLAQEDPAAIVVRRAELTEAWRTIAELPRAQREALLLREVRGLGYDEVAADLRLSHASVRSLLSRARRTLRMQLEKDAGALTGAQWLNLLTRLFGDTSNPALSSATRTAAIGLGTLAITGGAIVAPPLARHPHQPAVTRVTRPAANVQTAARRSVVIAAIAVRPSAVTGEHSDLGRGGRNGDTTRRSQPDSRIAASGEGGRAAAVRATCRTESPARPARTRTAIVRESRPIRAARRAVDRAAIARVRRVVQAPEAPRADRRRSRRPRRAAAAARPREARPDRPASKGRRSLMAPEGSARTVRVAPTAGALEPRSATFSVMRTPCL